MPWIQRSDVVCNPGAHTSLITVARVNFEMAAARQDLPIGSVQFLGILRYMQALPGILPTVDTEVASRSFWYYGMQWRLGNSTVTGRIALYLPVDAEKAVTVRVWENVP